MKNQPSHADFLPKMCQHVTPNLVWYKDGYILFTIRMEGMPFDSADDGTLFSEFSNLANTFAGLGKTLGKRLAVWTHLVRQKIDFDRNYRFQTAFCQQFADKYLARFQKEDYYENVFYLSVLIKNSDIDSAIKEAEELAEILMNALTSYEPVLLTVYQNRNGIMFSEVYEFISQLVNGCREQVPLSNTDAFQVIGNSDIHFGTDIAEIRPKNGQGRKFSVHYDLKDFGISKAKIFTDVLSLPFAFTLTQSLTYVNSYEMQRELARHLRNLQSVKDYAVEQQDELLLGQGMLTSGELMFGDYHAALVVYGNTAFQAAENGAKAYAAFMNAGGFRFTKASQSAPSTYFSQVPGSKDKPRCFPKTTQNLACTFGIHNYSCGKKSGNPIGDGSAIIPLQTVSKTVYDFNFHFTNAKEDNLGEQVAGHTLILGSTGTGKTTLQCALMAFTERFNPFMFVLDLDRGMEIFIRVLGGSYFALQAGQPTGLNPFQLPDTEANREFLYSLVSLCGADHNGKVTAEEEKQIKLAVDTLFGMDWELRHFSHLLQHIPHSRESNSLRERLGKWCRSENGRFAWCLDNPRNLFNPEDFYRVGFDLSDILKDNYPPTAPVFLYLFHLRNLMMDKVATQNGILATIIEEFWFAARFSATSDLMLKILKTDRKRGGWLILVSQSPADAIASDIFPAIIEQTPTKIYLPNPAAEYQGSYERCQMTRKEFKELKKLSLASRTFLVKQSTQSAFAKLDLKGFTDEIAVLSGSSGNVELLHQIMAQYGEHPDDWYMPFIAAVRQKREAKRMAAQAVFSET